jgi:hypothetical protein
MKIFPVILFSLLVFFGCSNNEKATLQVGASQRNITPSAGAFIAGDAINRKFTGVHDSLHVKSIVVSNTHTSIAILTFDCIGLTYPDLLRIKKEVAEQINDPFFQVDNLVISSTHSHTGPDVVGIWGPDQLTSGVDSTYINNLIIRATATVLEAWGNRTSAHASYAIGEFGNDWVYNISDSLVLDRSLNAIQFRNDQGKSIATITAFACHPTIMDGVTDLTSADYVGGLYQHLDKSVGGVNLFLQGAIGGWVQPEYEEKTFEVVEKRGRELGLAVEDILKASIPFTSDSLAFKSSIIQLPVSNPGFQQLAAAGVIQRQFTDSVTTAIAWFSIGDASFATHPGETTPVHSLETKSWMKNKGPKVVMGLSMDAIGYILSPNFFQAGNNLKHTEYMLSMSVGKDAGPVLMREIQKLSKAK